MRWVEPGACRPRFKVGTFPVARHEGFAVMRENVPNWHLKPAIRPQASLRAQDELLA